MKKYLKSFIIPTLAFSLVAIFVVILSSHTNGDGRVENHSSIAPQLIIPAIPKDLTFAGEKVPLEYFWVTEGFDRELLVNIHWHSSTLLMMKRANRYFSVIEPILKGEGIPGDFKYLAVIESNLLPAVSPAGAAGIWQFMKKTGQAYGLKVTDEIDERYHLEKATRAACQYLKEARDTFGGWTLAAAAYNAGISGIRKPMTDQRADNYYDLWLNTETSRYIHRILAIKCIFEDPEKYGFSIPANALYPPLKLKEEMVYSGIPDIASYAVSKGISFRALKELNPWIRGNKLPPPSGSPYIIVLPEDGGKWYPR